jgi:hypothetical protein
LRSHQNENVEQRGELNHAFIGNYTLNYNALLPKQLAVVVVVVVVVAAVAVAVDEVDSKAHELLA